MGEYLVGSYLRLVEGCDFVDYNVRTPGGGLQGLNELDVLGLDFDGDTAFLCEVTTHVGGLLYGSGNQSSVDVIRKKHLHQRAYSEKYLSRFSRHVFQFWSPNVPKGQLTQALETIEGLELVINGEYKRRVETLMLRARSEKQDTNNPAFRMLQILGATRD
jgi:hypothetical protein